MNDEPSSSPDRQMACGKCGKQVELLTVLPKVGDQPSYWIVHCITCGFVDWVAEKIEPNG
jgi:hypothetical protein